MFASFVCVFNNDFARSNWVRRSTHNFLCSFRVFTLGGILFRVGVFLFAFVWSVGGALNGKSRETFNEYLRHLYLGEDETTPHDIKFPTPIPDEGLVYDYIFITQGKGKWMKLIATIDTEMVIKGVKS